MAKNLFGIPLNLIVVTVYTQIKRLGTQGALWCSTVSLALSLIAGAALRFIAVRGDKEPITAAA